MKVQKCLLGAVVASAIGLTGHVQASIFIENHSFEADVLEDGLWTLTAPAGWTLTGGIGGTYNPTEPQFPFGVPDGQNSAFSNGGVLSQVLDDVLTASTAYILTVDVGNRLDVPFSQAYSVQLWAGENLLTQTTPLLPEPGGFQTITVQYNALLGDPHIGMALEIRLAGIGSQVNFDNVQLTGTIIPGPAPLAMLVFAAAGVRRRRR